MNKIINIDALVENMDWPKKALNLIKFINWMQKQQSQGFSPTTESKKETKYNLI